MLRYVVTILFASLLSLSSPARAAAEQVIAQCPRVRVSLRGDGRVEVTTGRRVMAGVLRAIAGSGAQRALTISDVKIGKGGWEDDTTVVLLSGKRRGIFVIRGAYDTRADEVIDEVIAGTAPDWGERASSCRIALDKLPEKADPAPPCATRLDRDFASWQRGTMLSGEARALLCETHERLLVERARFGLALAAFVDSREANATTSAQEPFEDIGGKIRKLVAACVALQDIGISTHNQGLALWPEFARAQCYRHLQSALDPVKDWGADKAPMKQ